MSVKCMQNQVLGDKNGDMYMEREREKESSRLWSSASVWGKSHWESTSFAPRMVEWISFASSRHVAY